MPVRRHADPNNVQYIWDSIKSAEFHHQSPGLPYILKFLQQKTHCTVSQAESYISQTLEDGLIVKQDPNSSKLPHPTDFYRIPTDELTTPFDDGKDWYCIECHLAGDVTSCKYCHRVFHAECSRNVRHKQVLFQSIEKHNNSLTISNINESTLNDTLNSSISSLNSEQGTSTMRDTVISNMKTSGGDTKTTIEHNMVNFNNFVYDETRCSVCNLNRLEERCDLSKEELNNLLGFILHRIKLWLPSNLTHTMAPGQKYEWNSETDLSWRAAQLFYQHMDMNVMVLKLQSQEYTKLIEFIADVVTIQHNVAIFHGTDSQEHGAAELMIRDTCHDITELRTCIDCYRHSNEKINDKWFCLPCRKPHKLVWAKQKGYPYWPAKVIKETQSNYDVRFFGGKYERSLLPKNKKNVMPIEMKPQNYEIKKSNPFNKALEELNLHQHLLENPSASKKYITENDQPQVQKPPKSPNKLNMDNKKSSVQKSPVQKSPVQKSHVKSSKKSTPMKLRQRADGSLEKPVSDQIQKSPNTSAGRPTKRKSTASRESTSSKTTRSSTTPDIKHSPLKSTVQEVIPISDGEEDEFLALDHYTIERSSSGCYGQVSSSTEYFVANNDGYNSHDLSDVMHPLEQPYSDAVEKMRRKLEQTKDKKQLINIAMDCMQKEIDRMTNDNNEHLKKLFDVHQEQLSETKKKQWCYNCEQDAIYHCCWNTAYCSPTCQQQHWQAEHKKVCRRKR